MRELAPLSRHEFGLLPFRHEAEAVSLPIRKHRPPAPTLLAGWRHKHNSGDRHLFKRCLQVVAGEQRGDVRLQCWNIIFPACNVFRVRGDCKNETTIGACNLDPTVLAITRVSDNAEPDFVAPEFKRLLLVPYVDGDFVNSSNHSWILTILNTWGASWESDWMFSFIKDGESPAESEPDKKLNTEITG